MPHSERIRSAHFSRTALCEAIGCADSGATALDGSPGRKPKHAKISRMERVVHGAAIRRRGAGVGACICAGVVGLSVMRAPKIHEDMDRYASAGGKIAENFVMDPSIEGLCAVILNPRRRVKDLSSVAGVASTKQRRE